MNDSRRSGLLAAGSLLVGILLLLLSTRVQDMRTESLTLQVLGFGLFIYFGIWVSRRMGGDRRRQ